MFARWLNAKFKQASEQTDSQQTDKLTDQQRSGAAAEDRALAHLQAAGLTLEARNYRVARGPRARGGEIDLILREPNGTLVFVEVRSRRSGSHGGAAASVSAAKKASLVLAAQSYIAHRRTPPPCRFDVVAIDGTRLEWLRGAFDAG